MNESSRSVEALAETVVVPFYRDALTVNPRTTPTEVLARVLREDFESVSSQGTKSRAALSQQLEFFWKLIPDLRWEPQEILVAGSRVVVRSVAAGTPRGSFMGVEANGTRGFRIDTIDIHELVDGRIARVHHVEDWATAILQVRG